MTDRRGALYSVIAAFPIALWLCSEAILSKGNKVVGSTNAEIWAFLWGHFWVRQSLFEEGSWPMYTQLSNFPDGGALWLKDPLMLALMLPVQLAFGIAIAVTISQVLLFVLSSLGTFLLCRSLGTTRLAAVCAGLIYAFCPHTLGEAFNGNIEALNTCWLPFWLWSWLEAMRRPRVSTIVRSSLLLFCLLVSNQYWAIALAMVSIPLGLQQLYLHTNRWRSTLFGGVMSIVGGLCLFVPAGWWIWKSLHHEKRLNDITSSSVDLVIPYVSDIVHFYAPMAALKHLDVPPPPFQDLIYPGLLFFLCTLCTPLFRPKSPWAYWGLGLGIFFVLLSLGPALSYEGQLLLRDDQTMYALPWWYLISEQSALKWMTLPHRMIVPATLFLTVALAFVLSRIQRRSVVVALTTAMLLEIFLLPPYRLPLVTTDVPIVDHAIFLRNVGGAGAVLNLPINLTSNKMRRYYWHQTTHQRPIAMSLVYSEYPSIATQSKLLRASNRLHLQPLSDPEEDPLELVALRNAGFDFVVLHSRYINEFWAMEAGDYVPYLNHYLGNGLVFEDGTIVYPLTQENLSELQSVAPNSLGLSRDLYGLAHSGAPSSTPLAPSLDSTGGSVVGGSAD